MYNKYHLSKYVYINDAIVENNLQPIKYYGDLRRLVYALSQFYVMRHKCHVMWLLLFQAYATYGTWFTITHQNKLSFNICFFWLNQIRWWKLTAVYLCNLWMLYKSCKEEVIFQLFLPQISNLAFVQYKTYW